MRITRRHLRVSLGILWLFDGVLQCQPSMFTRALTGRIIVRASHGPLSVLAEPLHVFSSLVSAHPALVNASFAAIQIALGLGLITRRCTRVASAASIAWALGVWIVGEGLGGLTTGATLLSGAPGAALLYALIAAIAWPRLDLRDDSRPSSWALPAWCALWISGAGLQLVAGNNSTSSFNAMLRSAQLGSPGWIAQLDHHLLQLGTPKWAPPLVVTLDVLVAIWVLIPGSTRSISLAIGTFVALTSWLLVQGLGDLTSGHATDPNAGPLIVLLGLAVVGAQYSRETRPLPRETYVWRERRAPVRLTNSVH